MPRVHEKIWQGLNTDVLGRIFPVRFGLRIGWLPSAFDWQVVVHGPSADMPEMKLAQVSLTSMPSIRDHSYLD